MKKWTLVLVSAFYLVFVLFFSIFTYSQIDLNLTLSSNPIYQAFQNQLINLGYYNRPLSAYIYIFLLAVFFILYLLILKLAAQKKSNVIKLILILISANVFLGFVSYPAFSHDFFNYLFDARIVTWHHMNPYFYRALDFPDDLWIRFMHWTHRTYPYGPLWLLVTIPFSFLGAGKFVLTLLLFKTMFVLIYLANIYLILAIGGHLNKQNRLYNALLFAFNPLIIIETLVSPHNESLMLTCLLISIYFLIVKKKLIPSIIWMTASIGVKFVTAVLLPVYLLKNIYLKHSNLFYISALLLLVPLSAEIINREAYPWYFIPIIGVSALISSNFIKRVIISVSFGAMLRYLPYLYTGEYTEGGYRIMNIFLVLPVIIVLIYTLIKSKKTWILS